MTSGPSASNVGQPVFPPVLFVRFLFPLFFFLRSIFHTCTQFVRSEAHRLQADFSCCSVWRLTAGLVVAWLKAAAAISMCQESLSLIGWSRARRGCIRDPDRSSHRWSVRSRRTRLPNSRGVANSIPRAKAETELTSSCTLGQYILTEDFWNGFFVSNAWLDAQFFRRDTIRSSEDTRVWNRLSNSPIFVGPFSSKVQ